jgi:hypothetical protein
MNIRVWGSRRIGLLQGALALVAGLPLPAQTVHTFQNGAGGYSSARDVSINTQYSQYNGGNGVSWKGVPQLGCYTTTGSGAYAVRYLLKFSDLSVLAGQQVTAASLSLTLESWNAGVGNITGLYLRNSWDPAFNNLGWVRRDATQNWAAPGASAAGVDTVAGKSFQVPALRPVGPQTVTIALDPGQVQSWIANPSTNQGIMLVNNIPGEIIRLVSTVGTQSQRPKLSITTGGANGVQISVAPANATLAAGGQQTFAATVTGSSNTAVTWTATGGSISSAGVFTAGTTAGSFSVRATSSADPSKFATATVIIQPAPAVSVSLSPASVTLQPGETRQFTATVSGTSNTAVTWSATGGNVSNTGLYTAGLSAGSSFTVTATSVADPAKTAVATVTVQPAPVVSISISPTSASLQTGQTRQFTATVSGTSNTAVTWSATGGSISNTGLYTAGPIANSNFTVTATSVADTSKTAVAAVTIQPAPAVSISIAPTSATVQPGGTQQFSATVTGNSNTGVTWAATGGTITSNGLFTAGQATGDFTVTARSVADTTKTASAAVRVQSSQGLPPVPRMSDGPYVVIQSPVSGMRFTAPATIRIYADPHDGSLADPDAITVSFLMNGQSIGTYTGNGAQNGYFALTTNNVAAGMHTITAQITAQGRAISSAPVTVYVDNPVTSSGPVYNLTSDVVLSGSQNATYAGTAANRCTITGNGFQIRSANGFSGSLTISHCDIRGMGTATNPSINVTASGAGSVSLTNNIFDTFGTVAIGTNDQAQAIIRNNEFRENTLVPVTSLPIEYSGASLPVFRATGNSTAQNFFQGNNVGLSTVAFDNTRNWLIGGNTDAESNVLMGVRCGFTITRSSNMLLRGNYSQHNYPHRFSQGQNFELQGDGFLAEHNVIRSSSWPVRGMGGELRYNLIDGSGNSDQVLQGPRSGLRVHHNIFVFSVSQTLYGPGTGFNAYGAVDNIQFHNNVMDGGGTYMLFYGNPFTVQSGAYIGSLRNNVFYNFATQVGSPALSGALGESSSPPPARLRYADYNAFYNPDAVNQVNYGLGVVGLSPGSAGYGLHDLNGFNGRMNPQFAQPTAIPFPFSPQDIWTRTRKVSDVLAHYRTRYSPASGSPLIGAGDPQDGANGNIGAIGNGEPADQFGRFGQTTTPSAPTIHSFTASASSVQQGQSVTLSWSVSNATTLAIAPAPGSVTGTSVTVTPSATTTYTLTAANAGGSATATVSITMIPGTAVSVSITPPSATLAPGGNQQFTATVTGTSNTALTWTATGGAVSAAGVYTAGAAAGTFTVTARSVQDSTKSASASIVVTNATPAGRPRIILDPPMLTSLRGRAQAGTPEWTRIKSLCNSYIGGGTVYYPGENGYPSKPSVGEGYQGSGYLEAIMPLGLCYQTALVSDPALAAQYGAKAVAILMAMSDPNHTIVDGRPVWLRDYGYGLRNFGVAMGIGYDWFYGLLNAGQRAQLQTSLSNWFSGFENDSFEYDHPQGNYFAGYYAAKCLAALAVEGDSPLGTAWWDDWYNQQHLQRVAPYYAANLGGGGWTEGFTQYGVLATRNQVLPVLAVKTAKGIDLTRGPQPYTFPIDQAKYLMAFTWPSRDMVDDRGELYDTGSTTIWPGTARLESYRFLAGFLRIWGDPLAPMMHKYARDVKAALDTLRASDSPEWVDFLLWDDTAPMADYSTQPLSYLAPGIGGVAARSDWSTGATFLSFLSSPYINFPAAGHEAFDKGSLAIERAKNPLVVNPHAWLTHEPYGSPSWTVTFDDRFGNWNLNRSIGHRILYNTFQVRHLDSQGTILSPYGQWARQRSDGARTNISRYEDGGAYVLATGQYLEDMYRSLSTICQGTSPVTSWSRQIIYLRPSQFVVYDRTGVCNASLDQYLAFHFPANPVEVPAAGAGVRRFDVSTTQFAGSMSTILPAGAATVTTDRFASDSRTWNKMWRTEIRSTGTPSVTARWLTVFDLAQSSAQVAAASAVNIVTGPAVGALLQLASGNSAVLSGTASVGTAISSPLQYVVPAAPTRHVITDLAPSTGYVVSVTAQGGSHTVSVVAGGARISSANGVLTFQVDSSGLVIP